MSDSENQPLHPIEKSMLRGLAKAGEMTDIQTVARQSNLSIDQARRGVEWLKSKNLIETREDEKIEYSLGEEGTKAATYGLPERRFVEALGKSGGRSKLVELMNLLGDSESAVALGRAKKNGWIKVEGDSVVLTSLSPVKENEELVLVKLSTLGHVPKELLSTQELDSISVLRKRHRGFVEETSQKEIRVKLSPKGMETLSSLEAAPEEIDRITAQLIQSGEWRSRQLRPIDVTSPAPNVYGGRKHPIRIFMDEVREVFVSLGFEEIFGPIVQSSLWNFDALFIPQAHSAREMQDTFYLANVKANLKGFEKEIQSIKKAHENGASTGSLGWRYEWKEDEASRVLLRTHTTAVTITYLANQKPDEARVFSVGRVFRNEKSSYKHNPEFYQIEGVMVGKDLNLRNLIYIISQFYSKLGFERIKFWPTYFPYTEPSLQTMVFYEPAQRWMELGGMGIFRPEVTVPLGVKNPVLAWGLSLDRLVMLRYGVTDIRSLFGPNLGWLRNLRVI